METIIFSYSRVIFSKSGFRVEGSSPDPFSQNSETQKSALSVAVNTGADVCSDACSDEEESE